MVYIVLGMHKSGTTLVSKILHESGINMGYFNPDISYDEGNKYERMETLITNISLLNIKYKEPSIFISTALKSESGISKLLISYIQRLVKDLNIQFVDWGFKDPRTCLTYRIWEKYIPDHKLIIVVRSPLEITKHYSKRGEFINITRIWRTLNAWHLHNFQILNYLQTTKREFIIIDFSEFLTCSTSLHSLSEFTGRRLKDLRNKQLYRNKSKPNFIVNLLIFIQKHVFRKDIHALYRKIKKYKAKQ